MTLERISAFITYCIAVVLAWLGDLSIKDASTLGGLMIGVLMLAINCTTSTKPTSFCATGRSRGRTMNPSIVKRCLVGAVLAIAATLPGFQQLHTSVEGLKLIADYEGCRLQPYQCSAGVWTDGIGNTSGVIPGKTITERQAAEGLISNVLRVERALERCVKQQPPQKVYDATVSFAFNVGTGNACSSTLVKLLNQRRWADACRQLPRWVYVKGVFNQGLDNRRAREMAWCLQGAN